MDLFTAATEKEDTEKEEDKDMALVEKLLPKIAAEKEKQKSDDGMLFKVSVNVKIPHSRMTKTCWETLVTSL